MEEELGSWEPTAGERSGPVVREGLASGPPDLTALPVPARRGQGFLQLDDFFSSRDAQAWTRAWIALEAHQWVVSGYHVRDDGVSRSKDDLLAATGGA